MASSGSTPSIVIADDEHRYADAHARMLPDEYHVTVVYGGPEALEAVDESTDLALLDRNMPEMEGDEVVARLRDRGVDCPIVMITAVEPDFDIIEQGFDDYIVKPASEDELVDCVDTWIGEASSEDELREYFSLSAKWDTLEEYKSDEEIETRVLDSLHGATRDLLEVDDEDAIAEIATETAYRVLQFPGTELLTYETEEGSLVRRAVDGIETDDAETQLRNVDETLQGEAFRRGETLVFEGDVSVDLGPFEAAMYVPLGSYGVLGVGKLDDAEFTETELKFTETLAENVRVALGQVRRERELEFLSDILSRVLRHNIRNELNAVIGITEMLASEASGREQELLEQVLDQTRGVVQKSEKARVVEEVMQERRSRKRQDLAVLARQSVERMRERYPTADLSLDVPDEAVVTAVPILGQSVEELIENAIVHNDADTPAVDVSVSDSDDGVSLTVCDDGPGIPPTEIDALREKEETDLSHGSGVGLFLVDWMVEQSGGTLSFDRSGAGTCVTATFSSQLYPVEDEDR